VRAVKALYRGQFMALLRRDLEKNRLVLPDACTDIALSNLLRRLHEKSWNVRIQRRYAHGHGVIEYLARYVRGGPIRDRSLVDATGSSIVFSYLDHRDHRRKPMRLPSDEFLRRLMWHVPEPRSHVVRLYGLYARNGQEACTSCRRELAALGKPPPPARKSPSAPVAPLRSCSICGRPLGWTEALAPDRPQRLRSLVPHLLKPP
jgi:hypothetical protein